MGLPGIVCPANGTLLECPKSMNTMISWQLSNACSSEVLSYLLIPCLLAPSISHLFKRTGEKPLCIVPGTSKTFGMTGILCIHQFVSHVQSSFFIWWLHSLYFWILVDGSFKDNPICFSWSSSFTSSAWTCGKTVDNFWDLLTYFHGFPLRYGFIYLSVTSMCNSGSD